MLSQFLPADFNPARPVAIIAGQGRYPALTVERLRSLNLPTRLIAFEDETAPELWDSFPDAQREKIKVGQLGHMLKALRKLDAGYAIMAGQITPRRLFKGLHPDLKAITILATLKERNAETIFRAIADEVEKLGIRQLDARAFLDDHLASPGPMTGKWKIDHDTLRHGITIAKEMARLDIGQGVVVSNGTVIAVEAFEGTDAMLRRAGQFDAKDLLFVKTVKPRQDYRFDVPVFGLRTIDTLTEAQISAVALEASSTLVLDKPAVLAEAQRRGIALFGY